MPRPVKYSDPLARLNLNVDRELYQRFKAACAMRGKKMTDVLVAYIEKYVDSAPGPTPPAKSSKQ